MHLVQLSPYSSVDQLYLAYLFDRIIFNDNFSSSTPMQSSKFWKSVPMIAQQSKHVE